MAAVNHSTPEDVLGLVQVFGSYRRCTRALYHFLKLVQGWGVAPRRWYSGAAVTRAETLGYVTIRRLSGDAFVVLTDRGREALRHCAPLYESA